MGAGSSKIYTTEELKSFRVYSDIVLESVFEKIEIGKIDDKPDPKVEPTKPGDTTPDEKLDEDLTDKDEKDMKEPESSKGKKDKTVEVKEKIKDPQTGDNSGMEMYIALILLMSLGIFTRRRI